MNMSQILNIPSDAAPFVEVNIDFIDQVKYSTY